VPDHGWNRRGGRKGIKIIEVEQLREGYNETANVLSRYAGTKFVDLERSRA
jgi:hypothetical protein